MKEPDIDSREAYKASRSQCQEHWGKEGNTMEDIINFVASVWLADQNGTGFITVEDAAIDLENWRAEDDDDDVVPEGLTAEIFAEEWNRMVQEQIDLMKGD